MSTSSNISRIAVSENIYDYCEMKVLIKGSFADIRDNSDKFLGRISWLGNIYNDFGQYVGRIDKGGNIYDGYGKYLGRKNELVQPSKKVAVISKHTEKIVVRNIPHEKGAVVNNYPEKKKTNVKKKSKRR